MIRQRAPGPRCRRNEGGITPLLTLLAGAVLGAMLGHRFDGVVAGGFIGFIAGLVFNSWRKSRVPQAAGNGAPAPAMAEALDPLSLLDPRVGERMRAMERRITALEASLGHATPAGDAVTPAGIPASATGAPAMEPAQPSPARSIHAPDEPRTAAAALASPTREDERLAMDELRRDTPVPRVPAYGPPRAAAGSLTPREASALWRWVTGGNTLARVGAVVLFIGVAFLLKYASEHITIPIELRLAAVALGGVGLLAFGWRLRTRRAGYAMSLQGAAIGVLYLTVFAALRLYRLLPTAAAFGLLFWIAALSAFLAIRQDSMALAVLGILGGFAAPVLTSSGAGSHVMLFSYYAVLNAGILGIAWFKAWRPLNVLGFACTFVVGTLWGVTQYRPEDFATTEPFVILFFVFYVAIATLYALRRSLELRRYVDATLVFGTPLVVAGLQGALVHDIEQAMAWSAIGASALYLLLARLLHARHGELRLLVEAFAALGIVFATLAVPLALDARLTSATWALEGAALVWVGARQDHLRARAFGLLLQLAAGVAFAPGFSLWTDRLATGRLPVLNSDCIGALLIACGAFVSAFVLSRATAIRQAERSLALFVFGWGLAWWLGAGWHEIARFVGVDLRVPVQIAFLACSAVGFAAIARRLRWPMARAPALALPAALLAIGIYRVVDATDTGGHLLAGFGCVAWLLALGVQGLLLRHFEHDPQPVDARVLDAGHAALVWLVTLILAHELAWLARQNVSGAAWWLVPWGFVPALMLMAMSACATRTSWPFGTRLRAYLIVGAAPVAAAALIFTLYANVESPGDPAPLPFLPLLNPLDLAQALVFVAIGTWLGRVRTREGTAFANASPETLGAATAGMLLFWVTCSTLRTLHHWADVPWALAPLWHSRIVQASLSLVWSMLALAAMLIGNRRRYRIAWVAGAALLAVVVAKLFAVDLSEVGGVERIVSFIGVGVLLLVVGYLAPVPPRREAQ